MFNLNEVWCLFVASEDPTEKKRPKNWRTEIRTKLEQSANLLFARGGAGGSKALATKKGLYNYAAWVD